MNEEFKKAMKECNSDWLSWLGQPNIYDCELFVLRRLLEPGKDTYRWYVTERVI